MSAARDDARMAAVGAALDQAHARRRHDPSGMRPPFKLLEVRELLARPAARWLVVDVLPERGLVVVWGASGSGKTFAVLDMALAIARGRRWFGRRVRRGPVVYVAAEGNLALRIQAYLQHHGLEPDALDGLRVVQQQINLLDPAADVPDLIAALREAQEALGGISLVVIDTLNRAMPGGNENAPEDMGAAVAAAKSIEEALGCAVLFVHHTGKDEGRGSRGHSSLKAAADTELSVKRNDEIRTLTAEKMREAPDGDALATFRLRPVDLGPASDIDPEADADERIGSCVVEAMDPSEIPLEPELTGARQLQIAGIATALANEQAERLRRQQLPVPEQITVKQVDIRDRYLGDSAGRERDNQRRTFNRAWPSVMAHYPAVPGGVLVGVP